MSFQNYPRKQATSHGPHVVIVGAGLSGLTAALYATAAGFQVTVLERENFVGGRCATEAVTVEKQKAATENPTGGPRSSGSASGGTVTGRFDTGATVWTMPSLLDEALAAVGLTATEVDPTFQVEAISPSYHAQFADGSSFDVFQDPARMEQSLRDYAAAANAQANASANTSVNTSTNTNAQASTRGNSETRHSADALVANYRSLRNWLEKLFRHSFTHFMSESFDGPWNLVSSRDAVRDLAALVRLGAFGKLEPKVLGFLKDPQLARVFSFQALYAGVAPRKALAVYGCISHMDTTMGVFYPHSKRFGAGMGTIAEIMAAALRKVGGDIRCGVDVHGVRLSEDQSRITDLVLADGTQLSADAVIATVDLPVVHTWLAAAGAPQAERVVPLRFSPSAVVVHGMVPTSVSERWPGNHHTISFGEKWNETFDEISAPRGGRLMSDPSLLVTRPAITAPERIVEDADGVRWEPVSVLAPCPNLESATVAWNALTEPYVAEVLGELAGRGWTGIDREFLPGRVDTPLTWADKGMGAGSPFGLAHLFRQTGPFRPRNFAGRGSGMPNNLVLAGSTTVPGVGVPTVMISGRLAAERLAPHRRM